MSQRMVNEKKDGSYVTGAVFISNGLQPLNLDPDFPFLSLVTLFYLHAFLAQLADT